MFLENRKRKCRTYEVDVKGGEICTSGSDQLDYDELISDPLIMVLEKKWIKKRTEEWNGSGGDGSAKEGFVREDWYIVIEYEQKEL